MRGMTTLSKPIKTVNSTMPHWFKVGIVTIGRLLHTTRMLVTAVPKGTVPASLDKVQI
jgi:hypothetical protein